MTQQSKLSMLAGYARKWRNTNNVPVIDKVIEEQELSTEEVNDVEDKSTIDETNDSVDIVETPLETKTKTEVEAEEAPIESETDELDVTQEPEEEIEPEDKKEEKDTKEEEEEGEVEKEEEEEEEVEIDIDESELTDEEKSIFDAVSDIYKQWWQKVIDKLSEIKWFDKVMLAVEDQLYKHHNEKKELLNAVSEKDEEIQALKREHIDAKKERELSKLEIQRYKLDENDEYMLDLKKRLSKDSQDETLRSKLRDEYLRWIAEVDPEFDMFEYRNKITKKKQSGIANLSWSNRSTAPTLTDDVKAAPIWYARRPRS